MALSDPVSDDEIPDLIPIKSDQSFEMNIQEGQEENIQERPEWSNQWEFLFSCISMSVGLGNVWRFPVTAYENGGGAFLVPYIIVVILIGRPLYFLELCLGQFSSDTQVGIWRMAPLFKGVGITSMISLMSVLTYYVYIMALSLHYLFASTHSLTSQQKLPWTEQENGYNYQYYNGNLSNNNMSLPEIYFKYEVVKEANLIVNISDIGVPDWKLSVCLIICWVIVFFSLICGVKSSGKVAHMTAILPYVGMSILVVQSLSLKGGWDGIYYFITPRWEKLLEPKVWFEAVTQSFFSMNIGFGSTIFFGSHNKFGHNLYQSSYIITFVDTATSFLAGCTIFATLGNLAVERREDVSQVVSGGGAGLVFITYADALAKFPLYPPAFAIAFFFMLFVLGLGSVNSCVGTVVSIFRDSFPKRGWTSLLIVVSVGGCACGMMYTTPGGLWLMELVSFYSSSFVVFTSTIFFLFGVTWFYGINNVFDDVEFMLGKRPSMFTKICLKFIIPVVMMVILICMMIQGMTPTYMDRGYPLFALAFGFAISVFALLMLPGAAIHSMNQMTSSSLKGKFFQALKPTASWGPRNPQNMEKWKEFLTDRNRSVACNSS